MAQQGPSMHRWKGRVALVSGASAGIGAAIARGLVLEGMKVVGIARNIERIQAEGAKLRESGAAGELHAVSADLTREEEIQRAVTWTRDTLGGADVLVNNAGVFHTTSLTGEGPDGDESPARWRHQLDLNFLAPNLLTREVIKDMRSRGVDDGHIVHIGSIMGTKMVDMPGVAMHSAIKTGLSVLTEGLRRELRDLGTKIRVTNVSPGLVRTEWWATSGRPKEAADELYTSHACIEPKDVADAVIFAISAPPHVQIHQLTIQPIGEGF